jgi:murein DD-endopeptidase MepM/ murein hydrolase activator NlpD
VKAKGKTGPGNAGGTKGHKLAGKRYIWRIGSTPQAVRYGEWAAEVLRSPVSAEQVPKGECVLVIAGPDLPAGQEPAALAAQIGRQTPVFGVGSGGLKLLSALDPASFQAAVPERQDANAVAVDDEGLKKLYGQSVKESPLLGLRLKRSYPRPAEITLIKSGPLRGAAPLRAATAADAAVAGWFGNRAFWGLSEPELIDPDLREVALSTLGKIFLYIGNREQALAFIAQIEAEAQAEEDAQEAENERTRKLTQKISVSSSAPSVKWSGDLMQPASGPITSRFGRRFHPILGRWRSHNGLDIGSPTGTPVRAAETGIAQRFISTRGWGNHVIIVHGSGMTTLYAHLSRIDIQNGQPVQRGQQVGAIGTTGLSTGPHLHFEVREKGSPRDPAQYLKG